ncbi:MAG: DUF6431 domain-containing protein [Actinomycetota bacterium]|jgi:hypothetical protein|nr:DUF6431 domain-containing protein [Actinomycetota bacterium]
MAIVWPCSTAVDAYAAAGRDVEVPKAACPACSAPMGSWSGYFRFVRHDGAVHRVFIPRGICPPCSTTHALLPAFCLRNRLDSTETIGGVIEAVASAGGVRPAARRHDVPHTTARGWVRLFAARAQRVAVAFAALGVELGGEVEKPPRDLLRAALGAIAAAYDAATALPGWIRIGRWRFVAVVCGGSLLSANTNSPWLIVGTRRFMPPVP